MLIKSSKNFNAKFRKLVKKNSTLKSKTDKKLKLLVENQNHPSLRLHKINTRPHSWSISIDMRLRILFVYDNNDIVLVDIGTHDEVY